MGHEAANVDHRKLAMKLKDATVFITGANRGIGLAFAKEALARGAKKVYAGARDPASVTLAGVEAVQLDVNDEAHIAAAAARCGDVTLLINNAGIAQLGTVFAEGNVASALAQFTTNVLGPMRLSQAFAPVLAKNGGGAILNVLSVASWNNSPQMPLYGVSKSAAWAMTNAIRNELRAQKTQVLGMHVGFVDTDLTRGLEVPKSSPAEVVARTFDALEAGADEVLADERSKEIKQALTSERPFYLRAPGT
jgi:NAD(P)-dependent dehydrogenase (short-subunit alcohol dehydrogenase family)